MKLKHAHILTIGGAAAGHKFMKPLERRPQPQPTPQPHPEQNGVGGQKK